MMATRRAPTPTPSPTEAQFQAQVMTLARLAGWLAYHPYDSRLSEPGYPDLTLTRDGRIIYAELKTARGRIRPEQRIWLTTLAKNPGVEVALWRPASWPTIEAALIHGQRLPQFTVME